MTSANIPLRTLGRNGPAIAPMGLGLMSLCGVYGKEPSLDEQLKLLDHAVEIGETFWDTSDAYLDNLEVLSEWFKRSGKRDRIFLASKFGLVLGEDVRLKAVDTSAEYCKRACEENLRRLGVECLDLYYAHRLNADTPVEETMRAMVELQAEGKIKHIGLCGASSTALRRACKIAPVAAVQVEYSAFVLNVENEKGTNILQTCRELGVALVCYGPIGRGLLTGTITGAQSVSGEKDIRGAMIARFKEENMARSLKVVEHFKTVAERKGCTPSQLAIAWLLKQGDDIIPIPGTRKIQNLDQNWGALGVSLTDDEEVEIRRIIGAAKLDGFEPSAIDFQDTKEMV
ncbi:Aldo/keto reductase [Xylariaceae sp. FL1272]|nr:Aldo/keto reductase [Xylariaceae sp. FL1272]